MFEPPTDTAEPDPRLPAGSVRVTVLDPEGKPLPGTTVTIGILNNSIAKGESRKRVELKTDQEGVARLDGQDKGAQLAYRVTVSRDGGTFAAPPFQMPLDKGVHATLHVYPVTRTVGGEALIVSQAILYVEMKDDRIQVQEALSIYNFGKAAWVPDDLVLELPPDFRALTSQQGMNDVTVEGVEKKGARIRGTFGPGRHDVEFRWQLPYEGTRDVQVFAGMPPHLAAARVMAPAGPRMKLVAEGFPVAIGRVNAQGERVLVSERELRRDEPPLTRMAIEIRDLPTVGPARWIVSAFSLLAVLGAILVAFVVAAPRPGGASKEDRERLLADLADLERAHRAGEIGPKSYARARRELIEELARLLMTRKAAGAAKKKRPA